MTRLVVDKNISQFSKDCLSDLGYDLIESFCLSSIKNSTATHPDMQFFYLGENKALVASEASDYYKSVLPDFELISVDGIGGKYPDDCILNIARIGDKHILTEFQQQKLLPYCDFKPIYVNQGYTKCSTCILNENAVLSADKGIVSILKKQGIRAYFLPDGEIELNGYKNGFWGGATGLIDKGKIFFNGNIESLSCFYELFKILEQEKIEPIYHTKTNLCDNGSIILLSD